MSDTTENLGETFARLWSSTSEEEQYNQAWASIMARELEDLRALGVNVDDPDALAAARADRNIMAQHKGRQMRALRGMLPPRRFDPAGLADDIRRAREGMQDEERSSANGGSVPI